MCCESARIARFSREIHACAYLFATRGFSPFSSRVPRKPAVTCKPYNLRPSTDLRRRRRCSRCSCWMFGGGGEHRSTRWNNLIVKNVLGGKLPLVNKHTVGCIRVCKRTNKQTSARVLQFDMTMISDTSMVISVGIELSRGSLRRVCGDSPRFPYFFFYFLPFALILIIVQ